jgi:hypothetical protein
MAAAMLPEVLAVCINSAINSGRTLSWKIQDNHKGTSVQLFWRDVNLAGEHNQESKVLVPPQTRKRNKKKAPSQKRRSQKRLDAFITAKCLERASEPRIKNTQEDRFNVVESDRGHIDTSPRAEATFVHDPLPQVAPGFPLHDKSPSSSDRTFSNLASTPSYQPNRLVGTTKLATRHETPSKVLMRTTSTNRKSLDLSKCYSKQFEEGEKGVPGVRYTSPEGISCWTPVQKGPIPPAISESIPYNIAATSLEDLMNRARDVQYFEIENHPGFKIRTGSTSKNISWTPITISETPIAYRTRSHYNHTT